MERIHVSSLAPGQIFAQNLYANNGQKLLNSGTPLTPKHLEAIGRWDDSDVILAGGPEELEEAGILKRCDQSRLKVGQRARGGLVTRTGQVLLEPGEEIEAHHLDALAESGKAFVPVKGAPDHRRDRVLMADNLAEDLLREARPANLHVAAQTQTDLLAPGNAANWPSPAALIEYRTGAVESLRLCYARVEAGIEVPAASFDPVLDGLLEYLKRCPARFTQLALLCPRREDYLPDHAYTVAVLAMAAAAQLRWSRDDARQVALAALTYDLGMLMVPERIRTGACALTDIDRARVQRHPVFSLAMLRGVSDLPVLVRLAVLQHHERENGSGYPRGNRRDTICDYARVLAVADVFAAATEPRTYRKPKLPYIAMEETLRAASLVALWSPAVRALVQAAGLFPVGSYLKLSDGRSACVVAANPKHLDRPAVQPLDAEGQPKGPPVDLATIPSNALGVVRPIANATG